MGIPRTIESRARPQTPAPHPRPSAEVLRMDAEARRLTQEPVLSSAAHDKCELTCCNGVTLREHATIRRNWRLIMNG